MQSNEEKLINRENCTGCLACFAVCPAKAIEIEYQNGFWFPSINSGLCVNCGECNYICKKINEQVLNGDSVFYAVKNKDEYTRLQSSSGGLFSIIAKMILRERGVVYGASFTSDFSVKHIRCDSEKQLSLLYKSKYVQSDIKDVYDLIVGDLNNERKVLFSGTPCQCSGIINYLEFKKIPTDNLILIDIICHGVPSPEIWQNYLQMREMEDNKEIVNVDFRDKSKSWRDFSLTLSFKNGKKKSFYQFEDPFFILFFHNIILREACYRCHYAKEKRIGDFTIGDCWGIWDTQPAIDDDKGMSILIINSDKGKLLWDNGKENAHIYNINPTDVINHQNNLRHPSKKNPNANEYWDIYNKCGFRKSIQKYADYNFYGKLKRGVIFYYLNKIGLYRKLVNSKMTIKSRFIEKNAVNDEVDK